MNAEFAEMMKGIILARNEGTLGTLSSDDGGAQIDLKSIPKFKVVTNEDGSIECDQLRQDDDEPLEGARPIKLSLKPGAKDPGENLRHAAEVFMTEATEAVIDYCEELPEKHLEHLADFHERVEYVKAVIDRHLEDKNISPEQREVEAILYFVDAILLFGATQTLIAEYLRQLDQPPVVPI